MRLSYSQQQMMLRHVFAVALALFTFAGAAPVRAQSALGAAPATVALAPGQHVSIVLTGTTGPIAATASTPLVNVKVDPGAHTVTLLARTIGHTVVHVSDGSSAAVDIPVAVMPAAGSVPARIGLTITGDPATPDFLTARISAAVAEALGPTLVPGSTVHTSTISPAPRPLASGFLTSFSVAVNIDPGAGALAVAGTTTVDVENAAFPGFLPVTLSFEDDPERITADGVLSRTTIDAARPTRIYYYHENIGERRRFCVVLSVNDSVMTRVQIVGAAAGPNIDVMGVGHSVTKTFLTLEPHNEGVVVDIAGGKPRIERDTIVGPGDGIVGAIDLRVLDGGPVSVTVMAIPPATEPATYLYAQKLPDDGHTRHGRFDLGDFAQRIIAYTVGGPDATYGYGNRQRTLTNADPTDGGRDYGDYGVLQRVTFDLANPGAAPATLYLYEKPLGGVVRSSFVVNENLIDVGCVRVPLRYLVARYELGSYTTAALDVLTMTDGGSNYPLEIGLTATPPQMQMPPISAAEGCFPKPDRTSAATQPADERAGP